MTKHREVARELYAAKIWRSVVFAGATLGLPMVAAADAPAKPAPKPGNKATSNKTGTTDAKPAPKPDNKATSDKTGTTDAKPAPKPDNKATSDKTGTTDAKPAPRPRGSDEQRPRGRGFILS